MGAFNNAVAQRHGSRITRSANKALFRVVDDVPHEYRDARPHRWTPLKLKNVCVGLQKGLLNERNSLVANNQKILLHALGLDASPEPCSL